MHPMFMQPVVGQMTHSSTQKIEMYKDHLIKTCHPYSLQVIENLVNEQIREHLIKYREQ